MQLCESDRQSVGGRNAAQPEEARRGRSRIDHYTRETAHLYAAEARHRSDPLARESHRPSTVCLSSSPPSIHLPEKATVGAQSVMEHVADPTLRKPPPNLVFHAAISQLHASLSILGCSRSMICPCATPRPWCGRWVCVRGMAWWSGGAGSSGGRSRSAKGNSDTVGRGSRPCVGEQGEEKC